MSGVFQHDPHYWDRPCTCGHLRREHGTVEHPYPCKVDGCDCPDFERKLAEGQTFG